MWGSIDRAQHLICVITYDMDPYLISTITLNKLCNAAKRGVKVYLMVDSLNFYMDKKHIA